MVWDCGMRGDVCEMLRGLGWAVLGKSVFWVALLGMEVRRMVTVCEGLLMEGCR